MKKYRYKKSITCVHGVDKNRPEPCPVCKASNAYAKKDVESLARRFDNRKPANFILAFDIKNRFNKWQKIYKIHSFDYYLEELKETGELGFKTTTLKLAYYTARAFPDLEVAGNRKLYFSAYSTIANSRISIEEKKALRKQAEEAGRITVDKLRIILAKKMKGRPISDKFKYVSKEQFLNEISTFVEENIGFFRPNADIFVSIKPSKTPILIGRTVDEDEVAGPNTQEDRI